jgi:CRP-like cAMP-binding protein
VVSELTAAQGANGDHRRVSCAFCVLRHRGHCPGADGHEIDGSAARAYKQGAVIYAQTEPSEYVFTLISGCIALHRDLGDGRSQIIRVLQPGAMFGAVPSGLNLSHGATALTNALACPIARSQLDELRREILSVSEIFV